MENLQSMVEAVKEAYHGDHHRLHLHHRHNNHHRQDKIPSPTTEDQKEHKIPNPTTEDEKFLNLINSKEKTAKLHFYLQDALGGPNATVWEVARSDITATSATSFGQVRVLDDVITSEPDRGSTLLGRAQGMITFTGIESESALTMNLNFYFTSGEYGGSSLCVVGRNPINSTDRELPVVGGTGVFRMARGYSISNTHSYDSKENYGVLEYTCYVVYPDRDDDQDC